MTDNNDDTTLWQRALRLAVTTLPVLVLLLIALFYGVIEPWRSVLMAEAEETWPGYAVLRNEIKNPTEPDCDLEALSSEGAEEEAWQERLERKRQEEAERERRRKARKEAASGGGGDKDDLVDDLLDDDGGGGGDKDDLVDDLLDDDEPPPPESKDDLVDDLLDDDTEGDATPPPPETREDLVDDLLADDEETDAPTESADASPPPADDPLPPETRDDLVDDLLADDDTEGDATPPPPESREDLVDDLLADDEPADAGGAPASREDLVDDLLDDDEGDADAGATESGPSEARVNFGKAFQANVEVCRGRWTRYEESRGRITDEIRDFYEFENELLYYQNEISKKRPLILILLLLLCAISTTALRHHIALRPVRNLFDDRVSQIHQLAANAILAYSFVQHLGVASEFTRSQIDSGNLPAGTITDEEYVLYGWITGFVILCAINVFHLIFPSRELRESEEESNIGSALLTVPLYVTMALISAVYFIGFEDGYWPGLSIYIHKMLAQAGLYIQVGLYLWVGMLLKRTRLAQLAFDVIRPWKLPPEILAGIVVAGAAIPTAYSGASGIFVIAAGAVIYRELMKSGARGQLALATTAMSGSLGVVLSPCLLVVLVAAVSQQKVTQSQLYDSGLSVFFLSALAFFIVCFILRFQRTREEDVSFLTVAPANEALPKTLRAILQLIPYALIGLFVVFAYDWWLGTEFNENSAPSILPMVMLFLLLYDRVLAPRIFPPTPEEEEDRVDENKAGFAGSTRDATTEASEHIGALLMLMGLSICLGAVVERAELMSYFPSEFGSPEMTMLVLMFVLVIIGMTMDPYGAVILVAITLFPIATENGIDPVHFWMVVLTAFELGYLTPPVALNHLLTRQVVGEEEFIKAKEGTETFWQRHERILLPLTVMSVVFVIVAFLPFVWEGFL